MTLTWSQGHFGLVFRALFTGYALFMKLGITFSRISSSVKCLYLKQPYWRKNKSRKFLKFPNPNFDLHVISFICTNFEDFTKFSAIFTRIRRTQGCMKSKKTMGSKTKTITSRMTTKITFSGWLWIVYRVSQKICCNQGSSIHCCWVV